MERNQKKYDQLLRKIRPILVRHYGAELAESMIRDAAVIYEQFLTETPSIGGRKNPLNKNMDMALPFFALYEASGRTLSKDIVEEMTDQIIVAKYRKIGRWIDLNKLDRPWFRRLMYSMVHTNSQLNSSIIHCLPVMLEMTWLDNVQMVSHKRSTTFSRVAKISLRNPRLRISFQICSIGFISGVYGGIWKRTIFSGNSNPTDLCHAAPSQQSNMMSSEYCSDNCFRKIFMHAVLQ